MAYTEPLSGFPVTVQPSDPLLPDQEEVRTTLRRGYGREPTEDEVQRVVSGLAQMQEPPQEPPPVRPPETGMSRFGGHPVDVEGEPSGLSPFAERKEYLDWLGVPSADYGGPRGPLDLRQLREPEIPGITPRLRSLEHGDPFPLLNIPFELTKPPEAGLTTDPLSTLGGAFMPVGGPSIEAVTEAARAAAPAVRLGAGAAGRAARQAEQVVGRAAEEAGPAARRLLTEEAGQLRPGEQGTPGVPTELWQMTQDQYAAAFPTRGAHLNEEKTRLTQALISSNRELAAATGPRVRQRAERDILKYGQDLETVLHGHFPDEQSAELLMRSRADEAHRHIVERAVADGKPVPPEVLRDYPNLQARAQEQAAAALPGGAPAELRALPDEPWVTVGEQGPGSVVKMNATTGETHQIIGNNGRRVELLDSKGRISSIPTTTRVISVPDKFSDIPESAQRAIVSPATREGSMGPESAAQVREALADAPAPPAGGGGGGGSSYHPPTPEEPGRVEPSPAARNVLGLRSIRAGLTRRDEFTNSIKETLGVGVPAEEHVTAAFRERARVQPVIDNQAASLSAEIDDIFRSTFGPRDAKGRITALKGIDHAFPEGPTPQDLAAQRPKFMSYLTPVQQGALVRVEQGIARYRQLWDEVGGREIGTRPDVMEGGFYLPRGRADLEGVDAPSKVYAGATRLGKAGFEKPTTFTESMQQGIAAGYEYAPLRDSVRAYVKDIGVRIANQHVAAYLKTVRDEEGKLVASTAADRVDPLLRAQVRTLRAQIAARRETLFRQETAAKYAARSAEDAAKLTTEAIERYQKAADRAEFLFQTKWAGSTDKEIGQAQADVAALGREAGRMSRLGRTAAARRAHIEESFFLTQAELRAMKVSLNGLSVRWKQAQAKAALTPRGYGQIGLVELQGSAFPDDWANAANAVLREEGPMTGMGTYPLQVVKATNALLRGLKATGDLSYMTIQGVLGASRAPAAYDKALDLSFQALGREGDTILGGFFNAFNASAAAANMPTMAVWGRNLLHTGGANTEFALGAGLRGKLGQIQNLPLIRQSNRAFGYFGDMLRADWAQRELRQTMHSSGKTWQELEKTGELTRIAEAVNRATGYTADKFGGEIGELVTFAPRFFQSKLETLGKAIQGLRPGASLDQAIARDTLFGFIGMAVGLTYAVNKARGYDTDFRPWTYDNMGNARRNPNFMAIRDVGGQDWKLLGTWDSLLGTMIDVATEHPARALRSIASAPVLSSAWDLISGKDFIGRPTTDTPAHFAEWLGRAVSPITWTGNLQAIQAAGRGDWGGMAGNIAFNEAGGKASPQSYGDIRDQIALTTYKKPYDQLDTGERREVKAKADVLIQSRGLEQIPQDVGTPQQQVAAMFLRRETQHAENEKDLRAHLDAGIQGKARAKVIQDFLTRRFQINQDFLTPEALAEMKRTGSKLPQDILAEEYWSIQPKEDLATRELDFRGRDAARIAVLERAKAAGIDPKYITASAEGTFRGMRFDDPIVRNAVRNYEQDLETLRPYFNVRGDIELAIPGYHEAERRASMLPLGSQERYVVEHSFPYIVGERRVEMAHEVLRVSNKEIDEAGVRLGRWAPVNPAKPMPRMPVMPPVAGMRALSGAR